MYWVFLAFVGLLVGGFGTLIGAGGGFILMPVLVLLYPHDEPDLLASVSLAVVFLNAASGSAGYAIQRRIDYRAGALFSAAAVPGAVLGAFTTGLLPRQAFDLILGVVLIASSVFLAFSGVRRVVRTEQARAGVVASQRRPEGRSPVIAFNRGRGVAASFGVGFLSSLLGIGGGIIHVPALVMLRFPIHIATATSHFVLAATALAGTSVHIFSGVFHHGWRRTVALGIGVVIGAQLGARFARHAPPVITIRALAGALALVGVRIVLAAITGTR